MTENDKATVTQIIYNDTIHRQEVEKHSMITCADAEILPARHSQNFKSPLGVQERPE